jgi:hypothetical protein
VCGLPPLYTSRERERERAFAFALPYYSKEEEEKKEKELCACRMLAETRPHQPLRTHVNLGEHSESPVQNTGDMCVDSEPHKE